MSVDKSLLDNIYDIMLVNGEYLPIVVMSNGARTMIPTDLSNEQIIEIKMSIDFIDDPINKIRLMDMVYINMTKGKNKCQYADILIKYALEHIKSIDDETFEIMYRVITIASNYNKIDTIYKYITDIITKDNSSWYYILKFIDIPKLKQYDKKNNYNLVKLIAEYTSNSDNILTLESSAKCYNILDNQIKSHELLQKCSDLCRDIGISYFNGGEHLLARKWLTDAYKHLDNIKDDNRKETIKSLLLKNGNCMYNDKTFTTISVNIPNQSPKCDNINTLDKLTSIYDIISYDELNNMVTANPIFFTNMINNSNLTSDGRQISITKSPDDTFNKNMYQYWEITAMSECKGINNSINQLKHNNITESDFDVFVKKSQLFSILKDRYSIITSGLYYGYNGDLITAMHLLTPQIEHLIRLLLISHDVNVTTLDKDGNQMYIGLTGLLDNATNYIIPDILYTLKAIYTDKNGNNYRNDIAHGLKSDTDLCNEFSMYVWWFVLKLMTYKSIEYPQAVANA